MDEKKRPERADVPPHVVMNGPPWGAYVDPDLDYIRGQLGSVGSGVSFSELGGFVTAKGEETKEIIAEARRILKERAEPHLPEPERADEKPER